MKAACRWLAGPQNSAWTISERVPQLSPQCSTLQGEAGFRSGLYIGVTPRTSLTSKRICNNGPISWKDLQQENRSLLVVAENLLWRPFGINCDAYPRRTTAERGVVAHWHTLILLMILFVFRSTSINCYHTLKRRRGLLSLIGHYFKFESKDQ